MPSIAEFIQCGSDHYTRGRSRAIDTIVDHYTGTNASARNSIIYFSRNEKQGASAHYFIDRDGSIYQSVLDGDTAWHAGDWATNCRSIGIEHVSAGEDFTEAQIEASRQLHAHLMTKYGINPERVIRHYDVTRKLCPAPYVDAAKWAVLHARLTGSTSAPSAPAPAAPSASNVPTSGMPDILLRAQTVTGKVLPWTKYPDYAGWQPDGAVAYLCVDCEWPIDVQAHTQRYGWLPKLTNPKDIADHANGCVGDGSPIDGIRMYVHSPNRDRYVSYRVATAACWYPPQRDTETTNGQDGYAGDLRYPIYKVEAHIV